jgi:hypothetical protein
MKTADLLKTFETWTKDSEKRWKPIFADMKADQIIYENDLKVIHKTKKKHQSKIGIPATFRTIQTMLAVIKDFLPTIDVLPLGDISDEFADLMKLRLDHELEQIKFSAISLDHTEDMLRYKNGITKLTWDSKESKAIGEVLNPYAVLFDDMCTSVESSAYIRIRYPMRVSDIWLKKKFRAKADAKQGDSGTYEPFDDKSSGGTAGDRGTVSAVDDGYVPSTTSNPYDGAENETWAGGDTETIGAGVAFVDEWWYTDPETGQEMMAEVCNGKLIGEVKNNSLLDPGGYGRKPIFLSKNYGSKHYLYGTSEIHVTKSIDLAMNEAVNSVLDYVRKVANPPRFYLRSLWQGLNQKFFGRDNEAVIMNRVGEAGFMQLPPQPTVAESLTRHLTLTHDAMAGVPDVTTGRNPTGVTSGTAIAELQEAGQVNIRYKIDNEVTDYVIECGWFMVFMILKFDTKSLELTMGEGQDAEIMKWNRALFTQDIGFAWEKMTGWQNTPFKLKIVAGQQAPKTRAEKLARADTLWEKQIYGVEDIVRDLELQDGKAIIQRYYERQGWSPEAVAQQVQTIGAQIANDPENEIALAQMDILQQIFPSIVGEVMGEIAQA